MADKDWFTEFYDAEGCAIGLRVRALLHEERSAYQHIAIWDTTHWGRLMVIDGCIMLTSRDNFVYHEMMSHPALFSHPAPRRVAIIGGGDCGTLREVLRHPEVEHCVQVEIDERVTRLSEQYFPELCEANDDPRAELRFEDGIRWMAARPEGSLDLVIIDSTDPVGPAEGLFRREFYASCRQALAPGGLLVQQTESPLLHADSIIRGVHEELRAAGFAAARTLHFPQPVYPSGWWSATLAGRDAAPALIRREAAARPPFATRYYSLEVHQGALALPPFLQAALPD